MSAFEALDWYETPRWYDLIFDEGTQREADFLEQALAVYGSARGRRVLEPACGSGRLVLELARRGWSVTGFDASEAMLDHARVRLAETGLAARLDLGRLEEFSYRGRFDLIHCLVSTFKYVLDGPGTESHLACVTRALKPGGIYVLGLHLSDYGCQSKLRERWVAEENGVRVVCNTQTWPADRRRRTEHIRTRLAVTESGRERRTETNWEFRTYDARQLRRLLATAPELELVAVHDFHYELEWTRELDDEQLDTLLVLRRRA